MERSTLRWMFFRWVCPRSGRSQNSFESRAAAELDVNPNELQVGLQPLRTEVGTISRRIFVADSLENGAGYARHLSTPEVLRRVIEGVATDIGMRKLELERHKAACDASCPDCLRSYDNRFIHPHLDWRLALDMAQLAKGDPLPSHRWLSRGQAMTETFVGAFGEHTDLEHITSGQLHGVLAPSVGRAALFGHPLWQSKPTHFVQPQHTALSQLRAERDVDTIQFFDLATLQRHPARVFAWLQPSPPSA